MSRSLQVRHACPCGRHHVLIDVDSTDISAEIGGRCLAARCWSPRRRRALSRTIIHALADDKALANKAWKGPLLTPNGHGPDEYLGRQSLIVARRTA